MRHEDAPRLLRAFHEASHSCMAHLLGFDVEGVSIKTIGESGGRAPYSYPLVMQGMTQALSNLRRCSRLEIMVHMAARITESHVFGWNDIWSAQNDVAFESARIDGLFDMPLDENGFVTDQVSQLRRDAELPLKLRTIRIVRTKRFRAVCGRVANRLIADEELDKDQLKRLMSELRKEEKGWAERRRWC